MGVQRGALVTIILASFVVGCSSQNIDQMQTTEPVYGGEDTARGDKPVGAGDFEPEQMEAEVSDVAGRAAEDFITEVSVDAIRLSKEASTAGTVIIELSSEAPFVLKKAAATEFVMIIPGASIVPSAQRTQIAPPGSAGIRSARAVSGDNGAEVRMFVDAGVDLIAKSSGRKIVIGSGKQRVVDLNEQEPRAQLGDNEVSGDAQEDSGESAEDTAKQNPTVFVLLMGRRFTLGV